MKMNRQTRRYVQVARARAAEATGRRIEEAFLARLMEQWFDEIRLESVAADAGVSVQTVIRGFGGKDGLLARAVELLASRIEARRQSPPVGGVDAAVDHLVDDYEVTGDAVIRLLALAPRHPAVAEMVEFGRGKHRDWVSRAFARQLEPLRSKARRSAVDALVVVTDVYSWQLLRRDMKHGKAATRRAMKHLVRAVLDHATHDSK